MPREIKTLIIDDRESDVDLIRLLFRQAGPEQVFQIIWESNAQAAVDRLSGKEFDLVLLDYHMPLVNGLDVLSKIRAAHRTLPVIMLTGQGNEMIAIEAMKRGAHDYLRKDQLTVPALTCAVMTVLERKRLEDEVSEQRRSIEQNLQMARELQQAFLPQSFPHCAPDQKPDAMGLRFFHRYTPTLAVGGDFFDVLPLENHSVGVFVSDVAGHGMQAALVTAALRTLLEELRESAADADKFLGQVNRALHRMLRQVSSPVYATAFYLKLDMAERRGAFASAGHPPQLHLRRHEAEVVRLFDASKAGPLLGSQSAALFPSHGIQIHPDDVFILFTDGIVGAPNAKGEAFGLNRLEAVAKKMIDEPPATIIDHIIDAASQHAGTTIFPDDVCLVAIEAAALMK